MWSYDTDLVGLKRNLADKNFDILVSWKTRVIVVSSNGSPFCDIYTNGQSHPDGFLSYAQVYKASSVKVINIS